MQSQDRVRIALLAAYAIGLHAIERLIPSPLPWLRFGLANIITLTAIILYGFRTGLMITLIRVFLGSLFLGTFLGPGFVMSLGGGTVSTIAMAGAYKTFRKAFSPFGLSLIGAFFHNLTQLTLAYLFFVRRYEVILYLSPVILFLGIITGGINGLICSIIVKRLETDN